MNHDDQRGLMIKEQRNLLLNFLSTIYDAARPAASLHRSMLGTFPEYEWAYCAKDLRYLEEKGYIRRINAVTGRPDASVTCRNAHWRATALGTEVSYKITQDPAMEI